MSPATLAQKNGKATITPAADWLQMPVREFVATINWEKHSVEVQQIKIATARGNNEPLSLTLSVVEFLSCIPWEGPTATPASLEPMLSENPQESASEVTLEDFSDYF